MSNGLIPTYARLPVTFERGEGVWLYDTDGKKYLDALGGIAVCGLGHAHPDVSRTISEQAGRLMHTSNLYQIQHQQDLGEKLATIAGMDGCFFGNSGAEANEAAIKIARLYGNQQEIEQPAIIVMDSSFHGRTMATLSATGNRKVHAGFEPLVQGFIRAPYNDIEAVQNIAHNNANVVAILVEPVQGEGGINVPSAEYLSELHKICEANDWLLMLDEIQTGNGRTGKYFAFQHHDFTPDVLTTAKGLGNGMPIGACLVAGRATNLLGPGHHGSTYGGNPLACATALTVVDTIEKQGLSERAAYLGNLIADGFREQLADCKQFDHVRHCGLLIGLELKTPCPELVGKALEAGLLINVTANQVIRLLPPLIMTDDEANEIVTRISQLVKDWATQL
ncbi:aspartate aminotransferase family protein [Gammaproteobacteria bacterium 45_16_T64]|nr:aspartate aminotransferase family protein [Gammaproteobacteria bacterium 45_16_T64]